MTVVIEERKERDGNFEEQEEIILKSERRFSGKTFSQRLRPYIPETNDRRERGK